MATANLMDVIQQKLHYLGKRQNILSQNIAHANTPKYKAKDLEAFNFQHALQRTKGNSLPLVQTSAIHKRGYAVDLPYKMLRQDSTHETTIDGNNVVLEEQMQKLSQNALKYQEALSLYRKMGTMLQIALGRAGV